MPAEIKVPESPLKILVVEHSEDDIKLAIRALQDAGYESTVVKVETPEELREKMADDYDVVLADYRLPGWTGMDALRILRQNKIEAPFILVTGTLGEEMAVECVKQGVADFVLKDRLLRLPTAVGRSLAEREARREQVKADEALRQLHADLEQRVEERTAALQESEARFRVMNEAIPQMLWTAAADGNLDYCNQRTVDYTGSSEEDCMGWGWQLIVHPDDLEDTLRRWNAALRSGNTYEVEHRLLRASDQSYRWHLARALPLRNTDGEVAKWIGTSTDIHEQKMSLETQAQMLALKDDLVSTVSHELRTPLASLRGFSELMLTRNFPEEKRHEFLTIIHRESNRLTKLINEFLDLKRMESGQVSCHFESVDLIPLIRECAALFKNEGVKHSLRLELPASLPQTSGDPDRLRAVLSNLISNAIKYSPFGGEVTIGARHENNEVIIWISDHGLGIPSHALANLFTKFYRVDNADNRSIGGTGLGLALVQKTVEMHHGRVWAESEYGEGSSFFVALPCHKVSTAAVDPLQPATAPRAVDILIVEDDRVFGTLLCHHFEGLGMEVHHTALAEQALAWCRESLPGMVLLDLHLDGAMDGWDLLLALKADPSLQCIPVIMMSSTDPDTHGLAMGGADYVLKTSSREALLDAVRRQMPQLVRKKILIADDDAVFRTRLGKILVAEHAEVTYAGDGREAMERLAVQVPDFLVLDLLMPELDGFEVLRRLRGDRRAVKLRTLVITSKDLKPNEKEYLGRSLASLIGKGDADLGYFTEIVKSTLGIELPKVAVGSCSG
jgi:PAS domain S-box-containing protein